MTQHVLGFLLAAAIISGVCTLAEILVLRLFSKKVRCPKCHRPMQRRPAWYVCGPCDCYVIFDFVAFSKHWTIKELRDESN